MSRQELRHLKGKLKGLVTGETIQINDKNMKLRTEANHLNVVFLSNEDVPVAMDPGDRRYCVVRCDRVHDPAYFKRLGDERDRGAARGLYYHLVNLDLGDFNEHSKPPLNLAKQQIIELCRDPAERFYLEWKAGLLEVPYQTCTAQDLYDAFRLWAGLQGERAVVTQTRFGTKVGRLEVKVPRKILYGGQRLRHLIVYLIEGSATDSAVEVAECCETFRIALQEWRGLQGQGRAA